MRTSAMRQNVFGDNSCSLQNQSPFAVIEIIV